MSLRSHCRVRGALTPRARAVLAAAQRGGAAGVPVESLVQSQLDASPTTDRQRCMIMTQTLRRRGLLRYSGDWRCPGANWMITTAGQRALEAAEAGTPLRPTDVLVHAMLQALIEDNCQGMSTTALADVQLALQPSRSRDTAKMLIRSVFEHSGWVNRIGRQQSAYEYAITDEGRLACADLAARLKAHGVADRYAADAQVPSPDLYMPANSRQITYAGRTVHVPRVRSVFDLGEALLLADKPASKAVQGSPT